MGDRYIEGQLETVKGAVAVETRPGWKTTEFWLAAIALLATVVQQAVGVFNITDARVLWVQGIIVGLYTLSRGVAKAGVPNVITLPPVTESVDVRVGANYPPVAGGAPRPGENGFSVVELLFLVAGALLFILGVVGLATGTIGDVEIVLTAIGAILLLTAAVLHRSGGRAGL